MMISLRPFNASLPDRVTQELRRLCIPMYLKGFSYLAYMLNQVVPDRNQLDLITKNLYPNTGQCFGVPAVRVERNIRTAICAGWKRGGRTALEEMAGCPLGKQPTALEFLSIVADYIRRTS